MVNVFFNVATYLKWLPKQLEHGKLERKKFNKGCELFRPLIFKKVVKTLKKDISYHVTAKK